METAPEGTTVLDGSFTSVQQALGMPRSRGDGGASLFLERFVAEAVSSGLVAELIEKHGVTGRLSVAAAGGGGGGEHGRRLHSLAKGL